MYCKKCGKRVNDAEKACPSCGGAEFSAERKKANFAGFPALWMLISFVANLGLAAAYLYWGFMGISPNIKFVFEPPFFTAGMDMTGGFNIALAAIGLILAVYSFVYLFLMVCKKQFLYGVLMVAALAIVSFAFFFYGGSVLSIILMPVVLVFPLITKIAIKNEWDYMD